MFQKLILNIRDSFLLTRLRTWAKDTTFKGFRGVSLYSVLRFLYTEVFRNPLLMTRANSIAFSFFMSLFPAFLVLFSLIPFAITVLPITKSDVMKQITFTIAEIMPNKTGEIFIDGIGKFLKTKRSDFLSIGFILSIYFSSNGLLALMSSFDKNHAIFIRRTWIDKRLRSIAMTLMLGILLLVSTVLVILGNQIFLWIFKFLKLSAFTAAVVIFLKWLIVIGSIYIGIAFIYRFGIPTRKQLHFFSPGASTAATLSLLSSIIFSFYVDHFGNYDKVYGSFVAGIVLLLWLQLNAIILIFGFELNAAISVNKHLLETTEEETGESEDFKNIF